MKRKIIEIMIAVIVLACLIWAGDIAQLKEDGFYNALRAAGYTHEGATYIMELPREHKFHIDASENPPLLTDGNTATFVTITPKYAVYSRMVQDSLGCIGIVSRYLYDFRPTGFAKQVNPTDVTRELLKGGE